MMRALILLALAIGTPAAGWRPIPIYLFLCRHDAAVVAADLNGAYHERQSVAGSSMSAGYK
jgi:hypothetical protein